MILHPPPPLLPLLQLTLAKDPATEALHKRIEDSRQLVGAFQPQPCSSSSSSTSFHRQRSSSLSRSRSGGGGGSGVFGGGGAATAAGFHPSGGYLDSAVGFGGSSGVVNLRSSAPPIGGSGGVINASSAAGGGLALSTSASSSSKTLPSSDRSQRLTTLRKRFSGGDATDLAVNAAFPSFVVDGGFDPGAAAAAAVAANRGANPGSMMGAAPASTTALPGGWQTMTNWRNQYPTPPSMAAASATAGRGTSVYQNLSAMSSSSTPPPPLPVKQTNNSSSALPNPLGGGPLGAAPAGQRSRSKFV